MNWGAFLPFTFNWQCKSFLPSILVCLFVASGLLDWPHSFQRGVQLTLNSKKGKMATIKRSESECPSTINSYVHPSFPVLICDFSVWMMHFQSGISDAPVRFENKNAPFKLREGWMEILRFSGSRIVLRQCFDPRFWSKEGWSRHFLNFKRIDQGRWKNDIFHADRIRI